MWRPKSLSLKNLTSKTWKDGSEERSWNAFQMRSDSKYEFIFLTMCLLQKFMSLKALTITSSISSRWYSTAPMATKSPITILIHISVRRNSWEIMKRFLRWSKEGLRLSPDNKILLCERKQRLKFKKLGTKRNQTESPMKMLHKESSQLNLLQISWKEKISGTWLQKLESFSKLIFSNLLTWIRKSKIS